MAARRYTEPDQVARAILDSLPKSLGNLFYFLQMEVLRAHLTWRTWLDLFAHSQERLELLNRTAGCLFDDLAWILRDDVLLRIARLNDPPRTRLGGGRENASLHLLLERTKDEGPEELQAELSRDLAAITERAAGVIAIRNRELGHPDFLTVVGDEEPRAVTVDEITELLDRIANFMNRICSHFAGAEDLYGNTVQQGDVEDLVLCLERGPNP